jgi:small subunit ribosomal protein S21
MAYVKKFKKSNETFGMKVIIDDRMPFEKALRIFKRKIDNSGLLREVRERQEYEKPSETRKLAKNRAKKRWQKKVDQNIQAGKAKKY